MFHQLLMHPKRQVLGLLHLEKIQRLFQISQLNFHYCHLNLFLKE